MKVRLDGGAFMPTRAHDTDAGLTLYAMEDKVVPAGGSAAFDTGVHIELPMFWYADSFGHAKLPTVGILKSQSDLNVKHGITSEGVINMDYTGSIVVKLYNHSTEDYYVKRGDEISQLVIVPVLTPTIEVVDAL